MPRTASKHPSEKQIDVLTYIIHYIENHGYQPSQAEMARHFKITKNAVTSRLKGLEERGLIKLPAASRERAIELKGVRFTAYHGS